MSSDYDTESDESSTMMTPVRGDIFENKDEEETVGLFAGLGVILLYIGIVIVMIIVFVGSLVWAIVAGYKFGVWEWFIIPGVIAFLCCGGCMLRFCYNLMK